MAHKNLKLGDLVKLNSKKYGRSQASTLGVVCKLDNTGDWLIVSIRWSGDRGTTPHLPSDLELVE